MATKKPKPKKAKPRLRKSGKDKRGLLKTMKKMWDDALG